MRPGTDGITVHSLTPFQRLSGQVGGPAILTVLPRVRAAGWPSPLALPALPL